MFAKLQNTPESIVWIIVSFDFHLFSWNYWYRSIHTNGFTDECIVFYRIRKFKNVCSACFRQFSISDACHIGKRLCELMASKIRPSVFTITQSFSAAIFTVPNSRPGIMKKYLFIALPLLRLDFYLYFLLVFYN